MKTVEQLMMLVYAYGAAPDDKHAEPLLALKAAIEELHRDAARYNWLKESDSLDNPSVELARCFHMYTGSPLDAAIDAAMEST